MLALDLTEIQRRRKFVLIGLLALFLGATACISDAWWPASQGMHKAIEWLGIVMIFICIAGRTWCTLYIGARKKRELVTIGPYSLCRNPLYAFTVVGAFGVGAQYASVVIAGAAALLTLLVFRSVIAREEAWLSEAFGTDFAEYAANVPRIWPNFSGWKDAGELQISPQLVVQTFLDASLFMLAIPASEVVEYVQRQQLLPVLLRLP